MRETGSERERERPLTVIETALASPLVSWVAGSVPACQPVCHHHCLVFSLRPSACSLYAGSCSGLTCFLYIDIFIATQTSLFPLKSWRAARLPMKHTYDGIIFHKKLSLSWMILWYDMGKENKWPQCVLSPLQKNKGWYSNSSTYKPRPFFSYLNCFHKQL